jgi:hypothetical protein
MNIVAPFYESQKIKEADSIWLEKSLIKIKKLSPFPQGNAGGRPHLLLLQPLSTRFSGQLLFAAVGTPVKLLVNPVAARTDPLILECFYQHYFTPSKLKDFEQYAVLLK